MAFTAREMLNGVKYLHDLNLAHRDIVRHSQKVVVSFVLTVFLLQKYQERSASSWFALIFFHRSPNVMMSTTAEIKLIDFGLMRDMADGPQTHMVGSPYWMPPGWINDCLFVLRCSAHRFAPARDDSEAAARSAGGHLVDGHLRSGADEWQAPQQRQFAESHVSRRNRRGAGPGLPEQVVRWVIAFVRLMGAHFCFAGLWIAPSSSRRC